MAEQTAEVVSKFLFGKREDAAMEAVHFDLQGTIQKSDTERIVGPIAEQWDKGVRRFVFHLARLVHMNKEMVGELVSLSTRLQAHPAGIIILVGVTTNSLQVIHAIVRDGMFQLFVIAGDEEGARRLLREHKAAADRKIVAKPAEGTEVA